MQVIICLTLFSSCINAQEKSRSYGYFDNDNYYIELYFQGDSIYVCNAAIPFINSYKTKLKNDTYILYEDSVMVANIRIKKVNKNNSLIYVDKKCYTGFNIQGDVNLSYYYSNDKDLLDEFSRKLLLRKQKYESLR